MALKDALTEDELTKTSTITLDHYNRHADSFWEGTRETLRHFASKGVTTVDISTDPDDQRNLIPYDGHPSAFANEQSADKLAVVMRGQ